MATNEDFIELARADDAADATIAIVGVGVCAASLRSLEELFAELGPGIGAAYLVAVRQQEGLSVDSVVEVLKRQSPLRVDVARDGVPIEPNRIYVGGPDDMITLKDGHIHTRPAAEPIGHRGTIDSMLISIAEHAQDRAVAVLLAGLGSDGTAGVTATKNFGGLSIAEIANGQEESSQEEVGPFGVVDLRLPLGEIAAQVTRYAESLTHVAESGSAEEVPEEIESQVTQIATILRNVTGNDFHGYKRGTFIRRVQRRMQVTQIETVPAYVTRLREDRDEVQHLFQDLLIGVTQFFRDPLEFEALEREIPRLFEGKEAGEQLRVWVLGCATGEEAYSIAILLREHMATLANPPEAQIFATDLDARALNLARAGRYTDGIANHIRADRLERWFVREGDTYCVSKELREMCIFSPHNIVRDAPFSRIDILSCRNLLIYLNSDLQNRVIPIFHFSLRPSGILFLGSSENVTRHQKLFAPVDRRNRVFRRLETAMRVIPDFPLTSRVRVPEPQHPPALTTAGVTRLTTAMGRQAEAIAERYAPAYVVVDAQYDVLHFSGRTGRYLEPSAGAATLNLMSLIHRDLRLDLRSALTRAAAEGRRIELPRLIVQDEDRSQALNLLVEPVGGQDVGSMVVVFQDIGPVPEISGGGGDRLATDEHVQRLEAELRVTRDRLQATIEELESTNEELKSSNEEYQSINEELQSANEEMETSKEELQSVNEELQTVNGELSHRVSELGRSNSDLKNLLESTQIATVFLDNDLRVRNFTPIATDLFHLLDTDVGRPLGHVVSRVAYPELLDDVRRVLKTLVPVEREVVDRVADRHFAARVLPYRSTDNYISGAVVTFTDLTAVHKAESALQASEERYRAFVTASADAVYRMSPDWSEMWQLDGREFLPDTTAPSANWMATYIPPDEQPRLRAAIKDAIERTGMFELGHRIVRRDGTPGWTHSRAVPILDQNGAITEWLGTASDVTAAHESEVALRESEQRFRNLVETWAQAVWEADPSGRIVEDSPSWRAHTGQPLEEWLENRWLEAVHPEDRAFAEQQWRECIAETRLLNAEFRIRRPDGSWSWTNARSAPLLNADGSVQKWAGMNIDITARREAEGALRQSEERLRSATEVARVGLWDWNVLTGEVAWSDEHFRMTGYGVGEVVPSYGAWASRIHPEDRDRTEAVLQQAMDARTEYVWEFRSLHPDGSEHWLSARGGFYYDDQGRAVRMIGAMVETTQAREFQGRQAVLVAELQHRTRNLMAIVRSMADKTMRRATDLTDFRDKFRTRLDALARVQGLLSRLDEHDRVTFDELLRTELAAHGAAEDGADRVHLDGPTGVRLRSGMVQMLAMALHELATNAVKYGALKTQDGRLDVRWRLVGEDAAPDRLEITWQEHGVQMPPPGSPSQGTGQGRELIERALPYQLDAQTSYTLGADGVCCVIIIPISRASA